MSTKNLSATTLSEEIYLTNKFSKKKIIILGFFAFILGVFLNFPIAPSIDILITNALTSSKACPISYGKSEFNFLWIPQEKLSDLRISERCFKGTQALVFKNANLQLAGPSIAPPGLKFRLNAKNKNNMVKFTTALSPFGHQLRVEDSKVGADTINSLLANQIQLDGSINADALVSTNLDFSKLKKGNFLFKSTDLKIPAQNIQSFQVPSLNLKYLQLKGKLEKEIAQVIDLTLGHAKAPIHIRLKGDIKLNQKRMNSSKIDLNGNIKFSADFIKNFAVLNLLLNGKKSQDGYYQLKITGNLGSPNPQIL